MAVSLVYQKSDCQAELIPGAVQIAGQSAWLKQRPDGLIDFPLHSRGVRVKIIGMRQDARRNYCRGGP